MSLSHPTKSSCENVSNGERVASVLGGAVIALFGVQRRSGVTPFFIALGALLIRRGMTGHCLAYRYLGINETSGGKDIGLQDHEGFKVEKRITIQRAPADVYAYWRDLENLPLFMPHLQSVTAINKKVSHWVVDGPGGYPVEWDAEIINEHPAEMIAWQTLPGADIQSAGSVHFAPSEQGTDVTVVLKFQPPIGRLGAVTAKIFGESPQHQLEQDLGRFKMLLEADSRVETGR